MKKKDLPILTIVTRHMPNKRRLLMRRLDESLDPMRPLMQHVVVRDMEGIGLKNSSRLVIEAQDLVTGYYVWMLDDDDECTCAHLPQVLERVKEHVDPDVIIVRAWMQHHGIIPKGLPWQDKNIQMFRKGLIGMPNFILTNKVWKRHLPAMASADMCVDWELFKDVQRGARQYKYKSYFLDLLVMRQAKEMKGKAETINNKMNRRILFNQW